MTDLMRGPRPGMMIAMHCGVIVPHRAATGHVVLGRVVLPGSNGNGSRGDMCSTALPPRRPAGEKGNGNNPDNRFVKTGAHCPAE